MNAHAFLAVILLLMIWNCSAQEFLSVNDKLLMFKNEKVFLSGVNQAWYNYAADFGHNNYSISKPHLLQTLDAIQKSGGNSIRVWLHAGGETTPEFNSSGHVTGLDGNFTRDLADFAREAEKRNVFVTFTLWNCALLSNISNVYALLTSEDKFQSYVTNALVPIVTALKDARALAIWEIINEPEGCIETGVRDPEEPCYSTDTLYFWDSPDWTDMRLPFKHMLRFVAVQSAAIHTIDPKIMSSLEPSFRRDLGGRLSLSDSAQARAIRDQQRERDWRKARPAAEVRKEAEKQVIEAGGDIGNPKHLLGCHKLQFGQFREMTFKWILENSPGYAGYIVVGLMKDAADPSDPRWLNKMAFKKYVELWPEGREIVELKKRPPIVKITAPTARTTKQPTAPTTKPPTAPTTKPPTAPTTKPDPDEMSDEALLLATQKIEQTTAGCQAAKCVPVISSREHLVPTVKAQRKALLSGVDVTVGKSTPATASSKKLPITKRKTTPVPATHEGLSSSSVAVPAADNDIQHPVTEQSVDNPTPENPVQQPDEDLCLPERWKRTLPKEDRQWISKALFRWTDKGRKVELVPEALTQLWWYPPQPALAAHSIPGVSRYFARPIFLWFPRKQFQVKLYCPNPDCDRRELASAGINQKVRQVADIDGYYNLACDNLDCTKCKRRFLSWSHALLSQLDVGHRVQFPCILTAKLACDLKVVRLLRNRGLGNSCSQLRKKLQEQHGERWLQKTLQYLTDCSGFSRAADSNMLLTPTFAELPDRPPLPRHRWFMQIYIQDVLLRLDEMKASITSVFGRILKIDSTKKVAKKLAGRPAKTALWCTNMGNEHGQVLMSVMTAGEGHGLTQMLVGVINRYTKAEVPPPDIIYTDRDCCGSSTLQQTLAASAWGTPIRLDIWHFMRRIATGCTTDSHPLYSSFMGLLSNCIFEWDEQDLNSLKKSKRNELKAKHLHITSDTAIMKHLSRYELALHCRRKTRGVAETTQLIDRLIASFSGQKGRDTLGVPLLNDSRMKSIWNAQRKHIVCIQDPQGVPLYIRTGTTKKGGVELQNYRCARGSTSLECFHLHLNRFIPGTLASDVLFQAYMVDGLHRWNEDRGQAATSTATDLPSYSGLLRHTANSLGQTVLRRKIFPAYNEPRKYTGEKIGIEYLYDQTGKTMEDFKKVIDTLETKEEDQTFDTLDEDDVLAENTDEIDDLTVSTDGLKESSDLVLEPPTLPPLPEKEKESVPHSLTDVVQEPPTILPPVPEKKKESVPHSLTDVVQEPPPTLPPVPEREKESVPHPPTQPRAVRPILNIPTAEDYKAMMSNSVDQHTTEQSSDPVSALDESAPIIDKSPPTLPTRVDPTPIADDKSASETEEEDLDKDSENNESVGPDGAPGYDRVQELAAYLISLRKDTYMTNAQATQLIQLWNRLHNFDKAPTVFAERFSKVDKGRFKAKKTVRRNVAPGVESTERIMRGGPGAVPASWPNANRYTEAIFIQLLLLLPKNRTRLDDAAKAYSNIRQLVLQNQRVVTDTQLQLPEISRGTVLQWFTKRGKALDKLVVTQGVRFVKPEQSTSVGVPEAVDKPAHLPTGKAEPHVFPCPENTAGLASFKGQKKKLSQAVTNSTLAQPTVSTNCPLLAKSPPASQSASAQITSEPSFQLNAAQSSPPVLILQSSIPTAAATLSAAPLNTTPIAPQQLLTVNIAGQAYNVATLASQVNQITRPSPACPSNVPRTTFLNRKRKLELEKLGIVKRKYERKNPVKCKLCGQERKPPVHVQYFLNWFCGATSNISQEDWKEELRKKGYKKTKKA